MYLGLYVLTFNFSVDVTSRLPWSTDAIFGTKVLNFILFTLVLCQCQFHPSDLVGRKFFLPRKMLRSDSRQMVTKINIILVFTKNQLFYTESDIITCFTSMVPYSLLKYFYARLYHNGNPSRKTVIILPNTFFDVTVQARFLSWGVFA